MREELGISPSPGAYMGVPHPIYFNIFLHIFDKFLHIIFDIFFHIFHIFLHILHIIPSYLACFMSFLWSIPKPGNCEAPPPHHHIQENSFSKKCPGDLEKFRASLQRLGLRKIPKSPPLYGPWDLENSDIIIMDSGT